MTPYIPTSRNDFHIAVFCASRDEATQIEAVFDRSFTTLGKDKDDVNAYTLGSIGAHNVVLVHLPKTGLEAANKAALRLRLSFRHVKLAFVVGVCGAVPVWKDEHGRDINVFLGDCLISTGIAQYDFGKQHHQRYTRTVTIQHATRAVSGEASNFIAKIGTSRHTRDIQNDIVRQLGSRTGAESLHCPEAEDDCLYESSYLHEHPSAPEDCKDCELNSRTCRKSCEELLCDRNKICRTRKNEHSPKLHFGIIGSANTLMKSSKHRDELAEEENIIAFETEGSGIWDDHPTIVLKAASNYADSHKNNTWQAYAMTVAACALRAVLGKLDTYDRVSHFEAPAAPGHTYQGTTTDDPHILQTHQPIRFSDPGSQPSKKPAQITYEYPKSSLDQLVSLSSATSQP